MNCILDWQFILLKPINLVKCVFFVCFDYSKLHTFLMDGHKYQKFYIIMHKYIVDIIFNFLKYIKKIIPLPPNFCPNFYFYTIFMLHFREIFSMDKLFLTDAENCFV